MLREAWRLRIAVIQPFIHENCVIFKCVRGGKKSLNENKLSL